MNHWRSSTVVIACMAAGVASACVRSSDGVPVAEPGLSASSAPTISSAPRSTIPTATQNDDQAPPGVVSTLQVPVPANTVTCSPHVKPARSVTTAVTDPQAPQITVAIPDGWTASPGSGDIGANMTGPNGTSAVVTIAATKLDPEAAFRDYTDRLMGQSAVSSVSVVPGELCDYSGQKLMGAWSDTPQNSIEFDDRIVHLWTNTTNYLVSVHVQAPTGVRDLDAAAELLTQDFEVRIP
jgi:hypothetical protein